MPGMLVEAHGEVLSFRIMRDAISEQQLNRMLAQQGIFTEAVPEDWLIGIPPERRPTARACHWGGATLTARLLIIEMVEFGKQGLLDDGPSGYLRKPKCMYESRRMRIWMVRAPYGLEVTKP